MSEEIKNMKDVLEKPSEEEQDFIDLFTEDVLNYFKTSVVGEIMGNLDEVDKT